MSFNEQFDQDGAWRQEFAGRLKLLTKWMDKKSLLNVAVEERLIRLGGQARADKTVVVFVGDCSSGKSELINAIFFAEYGPSFMPSGSGRATRCPIEMGFESGLAPTLRLLPIETRLAPHTLMEWRLVQAKWLEIDLVIDDASQLAVSLEKVTESQHVSIEYARALGFWNDSNPKHNPPVALNGLVQIPKWRHALVNIAHPLLRQGLVIFDMPGFTTNDDEFIPTVSLIAQAHAVVLVLSADTGATRSDLAMWHDYLGVDKNGGKSIESDRGKNGLEGNQIHLVVLNIIDTVWDGLSWTAQIQVQIERQKAEIASLLDLPQSQIIDLSAKRGLLAKITKNKALLQASQLPAFERLLGQGVTALQRQAVHAAVVASIAELKSEADQILYIRRRDLAQQIIELRRLKGESSVVVSHTRNRMAQEQTDFDSSSAQIHAVQSMHYALSAKAVGLLYISALKTELVELLNAFKQPGIKLGLKKTYRQAFSRLRQRLYDVQALAVETQNMLDVAFRQINAEFGFSLRAGKSPDLTRHVDDLNLIESSHFQYLGFPNVIRLGQSDYSNRLVRALSERLRLVFDSALGEMDLWNKSIPAQLDTQVRERNQNFARRLKALERIEQAAFALDERIAELDDQEITQKAIEAKFAGLTSRLLDFQPVAVSADKRFRESPIFAIEAASV